MKYFILIWAIIFTALAHAAPATSVKGEAGNANFTQNIVLPNYQVTKQTGINSRFETGNKNLLQNPSFEHATIATGWTSTGGGTPASSTTNLHDGKKSVTTTSTGAWSFYQDSTLYATGKSGQEAEASIWVYSATASANLWLCPRVNGASVTASVANGCVQYTNLGAPQKLTVFMLYGSTSTGIELKGSGAITYILDDAYLGDRRPFIQGITTTPEVAYTPTFGAGMGTPTNVNVKYWRVGNYIYVRGFATTGTVAANVGSISLPVENGTQLHIDTNKLSKANATSATGQKVGSWYASGSSNYIGSLLTATTTSTSVVYFSGNASSTLLNTATTSFSGNVMGTGTDFSFDFAVPVLEWAGDINAFTTKCDDLKACETVFSAFVSAAGVKSKENVVSWLSGNCTYGSPVATRWNCPVTTGVFSTLPNCWIQPDTTSGGAFRHGWMDTSNSSVTNIVFATGQANAASLQSDSAFYMFCEKTGSDYTASKLTQQIVQMRGVPVVPGGERIDTFSFSYGGASVSTVCSSNPCTLYNKIGTSVATMPWNSLGNMTVNFNKTYIAMNCSIATSTGLTTISGSIKNSPMTCSNCNSLNVATGDYNSVQNTFGTLYCQGSY